jgi:hypothetical protein
MRKSLIGANPSPEHTAPSTQDSWLDLERIAAVEITSEDPFFPIEHALGPAQTTGWRASCTGPQLIRLNFEPPTSIHRIWVHFVERSVERSQEFSIHADGSDGQMHEVVRQQFTFSPEGATEETEDFSVRLPAVASLELRIDPDRAHDPAHSQHFAVLQGLRVA